MIATGNRLIVFTMVVATLAAFTARLAFAEDYAMSGIPLDDPRWQNTLDRVNGMIAAKAKAAEEAGEEKTVEIMQHIEGTSYLARARTPQRTAGSVARALGNPIVPPGEWETIRIDLPEESKPLADGEKFLKMIEEIGKTFQYTNTLGAKATVKVCRLAGTRDEYAPLSMEGFVSRLKAGETWAVTVTQVTKACNFCRGAKIVNGATCRQCKGVGGEAIQRAITIRW